MAGMVALLALPLQGQSTLVVEGRAGIATPAGSPPTGWAERGSGAATGVHFALRRGARHYLYIGFSQIRTPCDGQGCSGDQVSTQWEGGVRLDLRTEGVVPWLRLGAITPSIEGVPSADAGGFELSDRGWGGEVGGGVRLPIAERISVGPGIRFLAARASVGSAESVTLRWIVMDLGLTVGF